MTTRDPRSRVPSRPGEASREGVREVTASMSIDISNAPPDEGDPSHPSLAVGTGLPSDVESAIPDATSISSPHARNRTPQPKPTKPPPTPARARTGNEATDAIGNTLGVYRLVELLGKGGMGYVYKAEHIKLGREVALKLLRGDYAKRRDAVLRFFQEAKTVNRIRHRNIVDVTDFVELDDGTTFIIMELLKGQSMGKWARPGVDLPRALAVLVQICDGLGAAHAVGVVHRDLKPDNVIIVPTSDGAEMVKLLDFGVAKLVNRDDEDIGFQTAAGSVIGTPAYMSPEQAGGMAIDHRSDIYSLGAIMYELFCGQPMFKGRSFGEYVRKHLTENPVPPRQTKMGAGMDDRLEGLILKCLSKDPNQRFGNILELRDMLLHLLGGIETQPPGSLVLPQNTMPGRSLTPPMFPVQALPPAPGTMTGVPPPPAHAMHPHLATQSVSSSQISQVPSLSMSHYTLLPETGVAQAQPPATPWWLWFVGGAVAVGIGIAGALWLSGRNEPAPVAQPTAAPIEQESAQGPAAPARLIELKFDSLPAGGVYAEGRSAELCKTPCSFNVDLRDGGPTDKRTFVVRAEGYEDKRVVVDFKVSQRDFSVSLTRLPGAMPAAGSAAVSEEPAEIVDLTPQPGDDHKPGKKSPRKKRKDGRTTKANEKVQETETKVEEPPPPPPPKVEPPPVEKKPIRKIDRTETIDPFSKK